MSKRFTVTAKRKNQGGKRKSNGNAKTTSSSVSSLETKVVELAGERFQITSPQIVKKESENTEGRDSKNLVFF